MPANTNILSRNNFRILSTILLLVFFAPLLVQAGPQQGVYPQVIRITAVGDMMLDGSARPELAKFGYDHAFEATRDLLQQSHVVFGNLEGPLTRRGKAEKDKKYIFRSPPTKVAKALARAGFDVVSLANNHSLDYGAVGLEDTIDALAAEGIRHVGAGSNSRDARAPTFVTVGDRTIAFLAYSLTFPENFWASRLQPGTAFGHEKHIVADVVAAREVADIVLVSFHWGQEGITELREYQTRLGRAAIDAGAQVVLGHHPHILQGVERYKQGAILYSLGNFTFGSYSPRARHSVIAHLYFNGSLLSQVRLLPINVLNTDVIFRPQPLQGAAANKVVRELQLLADELGTEIRNHNGVAVLDVQSMLAASDLEDGGAR
jgi:poly-gamma-glutamate synthesis protein (capsule biosynthesis protein)